jgi:hypothetical protein
MQASLGRRFAVSGAIKHKRIDIEHGVKGTIT